MEAGVRGGRVTLGLRAGALRLDRFGGYARRQRGGSVTPLLRLALTDPEFPVHLYGELGLTVAAVAFTTEVYAREHSDRDRLRRATRVRSRLRYRHPEVLLGLRINLTERILLDAAGGFGYGTAELVTDGELATGTNPASAVVYLPTWGSNPALAPNRLHNVPRILLRCEATVRL